MRSNQQLILEEELERVHFFETMRKHAVEAPAIHCIRGTLEGSPDAVKASHIAEGAHVKLGEGAILLNCYIESDAELEVGANSTLINVHLYPKVRLHVGKDCMLDNVRAEVPACLNTNPIQIGDKVKVLGASLNQRSEQAHIALTDNCMLFGIEVDLTGDLIVGKNTAMYCTRIIAGDLSTLQIGESCVLVPPTGFRKTLQANAYRVTLDSFLHLVDLDIRNLSSVNLIGLEGSRITVSFSPCTYFQGYIQLHTAAELSTGRNAQLVTGEDAVTVLGDSIIHIAEDASLCLLTSMVYASTFNDAKGGRKLPSIVVNKGRTLVLDNGLRAVDVEV